MLYLFVEAKLYLDCKFKEIVMVPRHCIVGKGNSFLQSVCYFIGVGVNPLALLPFAEDWSTWGRRPGWFIFSEGKRNTRNQNAIKPQKCIC